MIFECIILFNWYFHVQVIKENEMTLVISRSLFSAEATGWLNSVAKKSAFEVKPTNRPISFTTWVRNCEDCYLVMPLCNRWSKQFLNRVHVLRKLVSMLLWLVYVYEPHLLSTFLYQCQHYLYLFSSNPRAIPWKGSCETNLINCGSWLAIVVLIIWTNRQISWSNYNRLAMVWPGDRCLTTNYK